MYVRHLYLVALGLVLMTTGCHHKWCCCRGCGGCCEPCCSSSCYSCGNGGPGVAGGLGPIGPGPVAPGPMAGPPLSAEPIPAPQGAPLIAH